MLEEPKKNILMLGTNAKGGMRAVIQQYLSLDLKGYTIHYVPTHEGENMVVIFCVFILSIFRSMSFFFSPSPQIIHLHCSKKGSYYRKYFFLILAKIFRKKIVLHTHGSEFFKHYDACNVLSRILIKHCFSMADIVITLSSQRKEAYLGLFEIKKISVIPNFVPLPPHVGAKKYGNKVIRVLSLGDLGGRKGTGDLIKIFSKLKKENVVLNIGGSGDFDKYQKMIDAHGLKTRINLLGWVGGKDKTDFLENSDIFILPSYQEDLPMAILEAMSYELPVVSTNVAGIPSLVEEGVNGFLLEPGDIEGFIEKLTQLIGDVELRKEFGKNSLRILKQRFEKTIVQKQIIQLYDSLVE